MALLLIQVGFIMTGYHVPVLLTHVLKILEAGPGKIYIDATLGGGGYTKALLDCGARVIGIDIDKESIVWASKQLNAYGKLCVIKHANYTEMDIIAHHCGYKEVDGVVFDLGVSSHQIDSKERGFSFMQKDSPLDLRFDQSRGITGAEYVNKAPKEELYEILAKYSEEKHFRSIVDAIIRARSVNPVETTGDIVEIILQAVPNTDSGTIARIFQALRIAVNDELHTVRMGLQKAGEIVGVNGKIVVVSFHSLEDRIVKMWMRETGWKLLTKKPIIADQEEVMKNRRSRSAKLRAIEKNI